MKPPPPSPAIAAASDAAHDGGAGAGGGLLRPSRICYMAILSTVFWFLVFSLQSSIHGGGDLAAVLFKPSSLSLPLLNNFAFDQNPSPEDPPPSPPSPAVDPCAGRYIYMYDLPSRFNSDILLDCRALRPWMPDGMCRYVANGGMGEPLAGGDFSAGDGWFDTDQFTLDVIFHGRMKHYPCLTKSPTAAAAVFVPYYGSCDLGRNLFHLNATVKDALAADLATWLTRRPEWTAMSGHDHFFVAGRTTWDFRRNQETTWEWGNKLLNLPAVINMTAILIESSPWNSHNLAVPYPTYFHPSTAEAISTWQSRVHAAKRPWLFSFAGGPRKGNGTIRAEIIKQCGDSTVCKLFHCHGAGAKGCSEPGSVMRVFESATFCLEPRGDTMTRRSTFDAILAGCIPVFFHPGSAYTQYTLHLPAEHGKWSVLIMHSDVTGPRNVSIEETLRGISPEKVREMREEVIRLIPTVVYADVRSSRVDFKDAFDVAVDAVIERVARRRRGEPDGRNFRRPRVCFLAMISATFWSLIIYVHHTATQGGGGGSTAMASVFLRPSAFSRPLLTSLRIIGGEDRCAGRRVYMYELPARFNADLVRDCALYSRSIDVCRLAVNDGFGPSLPGGGAMPDRDVYDTDQYMLALIYHARMHRYECLTHDASNADAVFVPFYAGFDAAMNLWKRDLLARDALPLQLVEWLTRRPEWRAMGGRDHFLVAARPVWDFFRGGDEGWGNALLTYPAIRNTTVLTVEANPWKGIDFGVPFPSHFHPTSDADMVQWQERMRRRDRRWLWAFAGAPRPGSAKTVRGEIISQCSASPSCTHFGSSPGHYNSPDKIMELLESATFCIQPRGDSFTRKSTFDSMLAGCIPVFLHPASAYTQYTWHLPRDYHTYSVFIPHTDVAGEGGKNASIEERLRSIPAAMVERMREEVIRLIPRITYRDPAATLVTFRDAFDVAVDAVLDRVARRRRAAAEGREYVDVFDGHDSWKHDLLEDGQTEIGPHEFDPYL
uniref:Exostosin GT47 domain-containing protein n=1 Tax=Leersia perrieri TaxID=77586 RepID=A0A0D9XKC1_9ORYZ